MIRAALGAECFPAKREIVLLSIQNLRLRPRPAVCEMSASSSSERSHQPVRYSRHSSVDISNPETLCYTLGKTLGSGTYAKVKAAWSPHEKSVVSSPSSIKLTKIIIITIYNIIIAVITAYTSRSVLLCFIMTLCYSWGNLVQNNFYFLLCP